MEEERFSVLVVSSVRGSEAKQLVATKQEAYECAVAGGNGNQSRRGAMAMACVQSSDAGRLEDTGRSMASRQA